MHSDAIVRASARGVGVLKKNFGKTANFDLQAQRVGVSSPPTVRDQRQDRETHGWVSIRSGKEAGRLIMSGAKHGIRINRKIRL